MISVFSITNKRVILYLSTQSYGQSWHVKIYRLIKPEHLRCNFIFSCTSMYLCNHKKLIPLRLVLSLIHFRFLPLLSQERYYLKKLISSWLSLDHDAGNFHNLWYERRLGLWKWSCSGVTWYTIERLTLVCIPV